LVRSLGLLGFYRRGGEMLRLLALLAGFHAKARRFFVSLVLNFFLIREEREGREGVYLSGNSCASRIKFSCVLIRFGGLFRLVRLRSPQRTTTHHSAPQRTTSRSTLFLSAKVFLFRWCSTLFLSAKGAEGAKGFILAVIRVLRG